MLIELCVCVLSITRLIWLDILESISIVFKISNSKPTTFLNRPPNRKSNDSTNSSTLQNNILTRNSQYNKTSYYTSVLYRRLVENLAHLKLSVSNVSITSRPTTEQASRIRSRKPRIHLPMTAKCFHFRFHFSIFNFLFDFASLHCFARKKNEFFLFNFLFSGRVIKLYQK